MKLKNLIGSKDRIANYYYYYTLHTEDKFVVQ